MDKFWLVWNPNRSDAPKYRHGTREKAVAEAERLARLNRGQHFFVLEATELRTVDDMRRVTLGKSYQDEIPF